jgi:hypothetical protein
MSYLLGSSVGIVKQLESESTAAYRLELDWQTLLFYPDSSSKIHLHDFSTNLSIDIRKFRKSGVFQNVFLRFQIFRKFLKLSKNVDIVILRSVPGDPLITTIIGIIAMKRIAIYKVHHTKELVELKAARSLRNLIKVKILPILDFLEEIFLTGHISVTEEIAGIYAQNAQSHSLVYNNGILNKKEMLVRDAASSVKPEILFIATHFGESTGLYSLIDIIIESREDLVLHVVGEIPAETQSLVGQDSRIILHGIKNELDTFEIANRCTAGLNVLNPMFLTLNQTSSLKVGQYLSWGLPVLGIRKDNFPAEFPFYKIMNKLTIEELMNGVRSYRGIDPQLVYSLSKPYIDKELILNKLHKNLLEIYKQSKEK